MICDKRATIMTKPNFRAMTKELPQKFGEHLKLILNLLSGCKYGKTFACTNNAQAYNLTSHIIKNSMDLLRRLYNEIHI